jgi:hypothetical protein
MNNSIPSKNFQFNQYLKIILQSKDASEIIFDELKELEKPVNKDKIENYLEHLRYFNDSFIFTTAQTIINDKDKFIFVDQSIRLLGQIKKLKSKIK